MSVVLHACLTSHINLVVKRTTMVLPIAKKATSDNDFKCILYIKTDYTYYIIHHIID